MPEREQGQNRGESRPETRGGYHPAAYPWSQVKVANRAERVAERVTLRDTGALVALLRYDLIRRGVGEATIRTYGVGVRAYLTWCWEGDRDLLAPDMETAHDFTHALIRRGASPGTVTTYRPAVSALYRALRWTGATAADPMRDAPRVRDPVPNFEKRKPYTQAELRLLLSVATSDERTLLLLCGLGGLRNAEARAAKWADLDWGASTLRVTGKGGRVRRVYLGRVLREALQDAQGRIQGRGRTRPEHLLPWADPDTLRAHLQGLCTQAGVPYVGRSLHGLRHTAGTELYRRTRNLDDVARHLGHSQLETSRVYAEHENSATRAALDDFED
ncbi:Integrase/recombinase XerD [Deinococcus saxicola]|uniref:tyrosine-type recombinase/integrase n=1 Tax=Deinococcus saxicola TaxID=249406 RepID=UPI0039EF4BD0